jgi:hypothetical protein
VGTDLVGEWGNGRPDGRADGHFRLILSRPGQVTSISVYSSDASGNAAGGQVWHTANSGYWMLGVFQDGGQINASHTPSLGHLDAGRSFDLSCNDSGWFKPGQWFTVEVAWADGSRDRQSIAIGGATSTVAAAPVPGVRPAAASFAWLGMGADRVGEWGNGRPDGRADGHFRLTLPRSGQVTSIAVYSSDASGNAAGGQVWHSANSGNWMLGLFQGGRQLNASHVASLDYLGAGTALDLSCNDSGWFKPGQWFTVEVTWSDGEKLRQSVSIGG